MFPDVNAIVEQLVTLLETVLNDIMRFVEQNFGIIDRFVRAISDFLAWLEGLFTF